MKGLVNQAGGLRNFFGDGSDGAFNPATILAAATAPNGGTVSNLWDMNAGTVFTTGSLTSASDCVLFQIDLGSQYTIGSDTGSHIHLNAVSISTGTRVVAVEVSDDGVTWVQKGKTYSATTTPTVCGVGGNTRFNTRFIRLVLKAGGSTCTFTISIGAAICSNSHTVPWNIIYPSALNGPAVVKQFSSLTLPAGYSMTVENPCQGLIIYCQGNAVINGTIDMSKKAGLAPNGNIIPMPITKKNGSGVKTLEKYLQLTTVLQALKGGTGGNGGYGGGRPDSQGGAINTTTRGTGGIGGGGRINIGGFGGGGGSGAAYSGLKNGSPGGSITCAEIGCGATCKDDTLYVTPNSGAHQFFEGIPGSNGAGAHGLIYVWPLLSSYTAYSIRSTHTGKCNGGGTGGTGACASFQYGPNTPGSLVQMAPTLDSEYAGGFICLIVNGNVSGTGIIRADGGNGSAGSAAISGDTSVGVSGGGGGGGSGGGVIMQLYTGTDTFNGTRYVNGGSGGAGGAGLFVPSCAETGGAGSSGGVGTIHIQQI